MRLSTLSIFTIDCSGLPEKVARSLAMVLLALCILFPIALAFQTIKTALLLAIVTMAFLFLLAGKPPMSFRLYFVSCAYATIGLVWSLYGIMRENPGAIRVIPVMVVFPLVLPLCSSLYRQGDNSALYKLFCASGWVIGIGDLVYVLANSSYLGTMLGRFFTYLYGDWAVVDKTDLYLKFTLPNIGSIIFLIPFFMSALFFSESARRKLFVLPLVLLLLTVGIMSGRRGLILSEILGPAIAFILTIKRSRTRVKMNRSWKRTLTALVVASSVSVCAYVSVAFIGLEYYIGQIASIVDFSNNESNLARAYQFQSLVRGIIDAPVFGNGAGAVADYVRSEGMPWAYELYYLAFIFHYGAILFLIYAFGVLFFCFRLVSHAKKNGRSTFEYYFLSGFIGLILANATNPILDTIDYMWVIFIPYAFVNIDMATKRNIRRHGVSQASQQELSAT